MTMLTMRHDFRAPAFGPASSQEIYAAALEQYRWADAQGWDLAVLSEHHGIDDGWLPAPLTIAGVILGATKRIPVFVSASILPLHDPVRIAEQIAVLDNAAPGRLMTVFGAGYKHEEFAMAGMDHAARGATLEEYVDVVVRALTGEPFEWQGRTITVTPTPVTKPHPAILVGGGAPAAARRAARLKLPMMPMNTDPRLTTAYQEESERVGYTGGFVMVPTGPTFVHVTHDPERTWSQIGDYLLYEAKTYASYQTPGQHSTPMVDAANVDDLQASPQILVGTPDDIVVAAAKVPPTGALTFNPLAGGLPPELAWESLELFAAEVHPRLKAAG
ncbi:MAG TPA: LLM class flavin-dependent oxidoreductase [Acidimicrobiia bacterium]|jgi:alkanesulfonate monooxygenase SsuD/methylene tetrahydromethanopterin reductase-like flavin-dependent oxidoreductase (luciferase family)|nr:LLM class flavin-dependent oxidoreductase [Acidimicrobiia bacterium]